MVAQTMKMDEVRVEIEPLMVQIPVAAQMCDVSPAKMKQWVNEGRVRSIKIDRCRRIRVEDLREFVQGLVNPAGSEDRV